MLRLLLLTNFAFISQLNSTEMIIENIHENIIFKTFDDDNSDHDNCIICMESCDNINSTCLNKCEYNVHTICQQEWIHANGNVCLICKAVIDDTVNSKSSCFLKIATYCCVTIFAVSFMVLIFCFFLIALAIIFDVTNKH